MDSIKKKKSKPFILLFLSFLALGAMCYVLFSFPPGTAFPFLTFQISYLLLFFFLLFLFVYGLIAFLLKSALQGIVVASLVTCFLLFRLFTLTNPFFTILLVILFFCIEGVLWKRK